MGRFTLVGLIVLACPFASAAAPDEGARLFEAGDYAAAEDYFKSRKKQPRAQYWLGRIAMEIGEFEDAGEHFERACEAEPDIHEYVLWLGRAYGSRAREASMFTKGILAPKIRDAFARAVELKPDDVESRANLIDFYLEAPSFLGGSFEKAREQAAVIGRFDPVAGIENRARVARAESGPEAALAILEEGVRSHRDAEPLYVRAAMIAQQLDDWDRSVQLLEAAAAHNADAWSARYQIGRAAAIRGNNLERGAEALEEFLAGAPEDSGYPPDAPHYRIAQIYEHLEQRDLARSHFQAALDANPDSREAKKGLRRLGD